jgi:hypothetical protein
MMIYRDKIVKVTPKSQRAKEIIAERKINNKKIWSSREKKRRLERLWRGSLNDNRCLDYKFDMSGERYKVFQVALFFYS